jgi:hypothetical protein
MSADESYAKAITESVYWDGIDENNSSTVKEFIDALTRFFMTISIIDIENKYKQNLIQLLSDIFRNITSNNKNKANAINSMFLMSIVHVIHSKVGELTPLELMLLENNLMFLEENSLTGFIPILHLSEQRLFIEEYSKNNVYHLIVFNKAKPDDPLISNSSVVDILKAISITKQSSFSNNDKKSIIDSIRASALDMDTYKDVIYSARAVHDELNKGKKPCKFGKGCYQLNWPHMREFSHNFSNNRNGKVGSKRKGGKTKGGKRTSKKTYQCVRQTRKKYTSRASPPYPA